jgi:hypothetical protein
VLVLSNRRLGPGVELLVSDGVAASVLRATAAAAQPFASSRWEQELVRWLEERAAASDPSERWLDVTDIAWTPEHFEPQRRFLIDAILRAAAGSEHALVLDRWRRLVEAHPADSVQVGRRWIWQPTA